MSSFREHAEMDGAHWRGRLSAASGYAIDYPLAVVILGELLTSTVLNLFVVLAIPPVREVSSLESHPGDSRAQVTASRRAETLLDDGRPNGGEARGGLRLPSSGGLAPTPGGHPITQALIAEGVIGDFRPPASFVSDSRRSICETLTSGTRLELRGAGAVGIEPTTC